MVTVLASLLTMRNVRAMAVITESGGWTHPMIDTKRLLNLKERDLIVPRPNRESAEGITVMRSGLYESKLGWRA